VSEQTRFTTYRWFDRYGNARAVEIFHEDDTRDCRVWAYTGPDDARILVGFMDTAGKFTRLQRSDAERLGLDTSATWNDLFELCRIAHRASR